MPRSLALHLLVRDSALEVFTISKGWVSLQAGLVSMQCGELLRRHEAVPCRDEFRRSNVSGYLEMHGNDLLRSKRNFVTRRHGQRGEFLPREVHESRCEMR